MARDIVWRAVFSFRARDIERGPWCLLLCAAVIRALLRARRISIVRDGGSRDQHDKGGRTYHRIILPGGDLFARTIAGTSSATAFRFRGGALVAVGRATGFVPHRATRSGACCINSCSTIAAAVATFSEFAIPSIGIATA